MDETDEKVKKQNHITEMCARLESAWLVNPELRLGQLIMNVLPKKFEGDPFHIEDLDLIKAVESYSFKSFSEARRIFRQRHKE